jgi:trimethylamine:corrinoid methyltransferase-like protein
METLLRVLSEDEKTQVHERSLKILAETGVKVDTAMGRQYLKDAGAEVNENSKIVKFPRAMVEESLRLAPKDFTLGARRPGWDLSMNAGECTLIPDGEGMTVIDRKTGEHRPTTYKDWLEATRLIDALDGRYGEWLIPRLGVHEAQESWEMAGKKDILEEAREKVEHLLSTHEPLPLSDVVEKELDKIQKRANQSSEQRNS